LPRIAAYAHVCVAVVAALRAAVAAAIATFPTVAIVSAGSASHGANHEASLAAIGRAAAFARPASFD
jgi:hypothetical protein